ncbi:MAG: glycosyltransferase [Bacteroidetes bacterium]|nr:MAG: glycosyltransferase [Bacteroidota bacterium]
MIVGGYLIFAFLLLYIHLLGVSRAGRPPLKERASIRTVEVSVLIPYRDEEKALIELLKCIQRLSVKPKELIFIDDHSSDRSSELVESHEFSLPVRQLKLGDDEAGKKQALRKGVEEASGTYILTWDADIRVPADYFMHLEKEKACDLLILPVTMCNSRWFSPFFELDYAYLFNLHWGLSGYNRQLTCSGANLLFLKSSYLESSTDLSHRTHASGDDLFLLSDFIRDDRTIETSMKSELAVWTSLPGTFMEVIQQRLRWLSKLGGVSNRTMFWMALLGLMYHLYPILVICYNPSLAFILLIKIVFDLMMFIPYLRRFSRGKLLAFVPVFSLLYPLYLLILPISRMFMKLSWKGRRI